MLYREHRGRCSGVLEIVGDVCYPYKVTKSTKWARRYLEGAVAGADGAGGVTFPLTPSIPTTVTVPHRHLVDRRRWGDPV